MATKLPGSSSCVKIIIGSNNTSTSEESFVSSNVTITTTDDASSADQVNANDDSECPLSEGGGDDKIASPKDDVLPTYVLQPKEISKNIDLMKTVAMMMESKIQQPLKGTDMEKLRDLFGDIHRFPEAYQKFASIVHQIQYLNVTTNWTIPPTDEVDDGSNILTRFLKSRTNESESQQDIRKRVMINLLNELLRVYNRYQTVQEKLEERLKSFANSVIEKSVQHQSSLEESKAIAPNPNLDCSDEDDPHQPLLNRVGNGAVGDRRQDGKMYAVILENVETLAEILRKGERQGAEVLDSIDVLRELINWDHKQITLESTVVEGRGESVSDSLDNVPEVVVQRRNNCHRESNVGRNRKVWIISAVFISFLALLLIITVALSFLQFNY